MWRMYLPGADVFGPFSPTRWRIWVERYVNSQSSMNSQRCARPDSTASGISPMSTRMVSTMDFLNSKPPSSRSTLDRKFMRTRCFCGYLRHRERIASTTMTLNSSAMSAMKDPICFMRRSTLLSLPVLRSVVMASVAIERFESAIMFSRSTLHVVTVSGNAIATLLSARTAAKRRVGLGEERKSWSTVMAGVSSRCVTLGSWQMARAASKMTISERCRRQLSRKS
mmetsp:Transcript_51956/g.126738  ORF Transcript_51956/g.126738 Transcript_51956/m.126738 type:complete len:225 (+) Transcript_51956:1287-1961(+)